MPRVRVAAAQLNIVVGDLTGNVARILDAYDAAVAVGADLVVFPELSITGYPPEDLLLRPAFVAEAAEALDKVAARTGHPAAIVGFPESGRDLANAAAVLAHGRVLGVYRKHLLPNYSVFDEQRYFVPGDSFGPLFTIAGVRVGVSICEDAWSPIGPIAHQAAGGAELAVNLNASPYYAGRLHERETMLSTRAADASIPVVYANLVGGQDELVFDGGSLVVDAQGDVIARAKQFEEDLLVVDLDVRATFRKRLLDPRGRARGGQLPEVAVSEAHLASRAAPPRVEIPLPPVREVYEALVLGTRDYVCKNGFADVHIGLSGGVDSALVAAIAVDALGAEHVTGVLMPSRFSSDHSVTDAHEVATNLGIATITVPIALAHDAFEAMLTDVLASAPPGLAEENVQSRIRGNVLMTISNKLGSLVLTTGNKSEMATGYATLYGDMVGGFAVIKDVPKTLVYALCADRNERAGREVIPSSILTKPPSAELRPDQKDSDSLPDYNELDPILEGYIEDDLATSDLVDAGFEPSTVRRIASLVDRNEYKRRQAPPGVKIGTRNFGRDRRYPISNFFHTGPTTKLPR
jgi:NAD+ synthase (glutamine-hydrolysing)